MAKCKWCGNLYLKQSNAQKYCSSYCKHEAKKETDRVYINKHNLRRCHNTRVKNLVTLGSLGTSSSFHKKSTFKDEYKSIRKEIKRLHL